MMMMICSSAKLPIVLSHGVKNDLHHPLHRSIGRDLDLVIIHSVHARLSDSLQTAASFWLGNRSISAAFVCVYWLLFYSPMGVFSPLLSVLLRYRSPRNI
ncbi:hypothetical protein AMTRI_Chr12g233760 [Amborella trichopoda]